MSEFARYIGNPSHHIELSPKRSQAPGNCWATGHRDRVKWSASLNKSKLIGFYPTLESEPSDPFVHPHQLFYGGELTSLTTEVGHDSSEKQ